MKFRFFIPVLLLVAVLWGCSSGAPYRLGGGMVSTPSPGSDSAKRSRPSKYCLYPDEWETILSQPVAFHCVRTEPKDCDPADLSCEWEIVEENVPYVLAATDIEVSQVFRHDQKQMILKELCPRPDDPDPKYYYSWKCHPPDWGSIYSVTLWENLSRPGNEKPQNGDRFNVYLRKVDASSELPASLVCPEGSGQGAGMGTMSLVGGSLSSGDLEGEIISITVDGEKKRAMWFFSSDALKADIASADVRRKVDEVAFQETDYDVFLDLLKGYLDESEKLVFLVEKGMVSEDDLSLPETIDYHIFVILEESKPGGRTLQLGAFNPIPPAPEAPWFDYYIPESKPVIYLYPKEARDVSVRIEPEDGWVTVSDPWYPPQTGWEKIKAYPDGHLVYQGEIYPYLYYETMVAGYKIPDKGFVVEKEDWVVFLDFLVGKLGLHGREKEEFLDYWISRLSEVDQDYLFITFFSQEEIERVDPLIIDPSPETVVRVRLYFKPLDYPYSVDAPPLSEVSQRSGFTAVEWGGILDEREKVD